MMKALTAFLLLITCQIFSSADETKIVATSEWSKSVETKYNQSLRGRMLLGYGHSPAHAGAVPETQFYIELQNVSTAIGAPMRIYFDAGRGFECELTDSNGKAVPEVGGAGSGGGPGPEWITLPYDSTIRLRASMYGYGAIPADGLALVMPPPSLKRWSIRPGAANACFLSGKLTINTPTDYVPKNFDESRAVWSGTLELPKMKIEVPAP